MRCSLLLAFTLSLFLCSVVGVEARAFTNKIGVSPWIVDFT
jgi:hypothetical protein